MRQARCITEFWRSCFWSFVSFAGCAVAGYARSVLSPPSVVPLPATTQPARFLLMQLGQRLKSWLPSAFWSHSWQQCFAAKKSIVPNASGQSSGMNMHTPNERPIPLLFGARDATPSSPNEDEATLRSSPFGGEAAFF